MTEHMKIITYFPSSSNSWYSSVKRVQVMVAILDVCVCFKWWLFCNTNVFISLVCRESMFLEKCSWNEKGRMDILLAACDWLLYSIHSTRCHGSCTPLLSSHAHTHEATVWRHPHTFIVHHTVTSQQQYIVYCMNRHLK